MIGMGGGAGRVGRSSWAVVIHALSSCQSRIREVMMTVEATDGVVPSPWLDRIEELETRVRDLEARVEMLTPWGRGRRRQVAEPVPTTVMEGWW